MNKKHSLLPFSKHWLFILPLIVLIAVWAIIPAIRAFTLIINPVGRSAPHNPVHLSLLRRYILRHLMAFTSLAGWQSLHPSHLPSSWCTASKALVWRCCPGHCSFIVLITMSCYMIVEGAAKARDRALRWEHASRTT